MGIPLISIFIQCLIKKHNKIVEDYATKISYFCVMSKKDKLIARFLKLPKDFHYHEVLQLVGYFGFKEGNKGQTSG